MPLSVPCAAPLPWLLADVGGSNARFGWVDTLEQGPTHVQTFAVAEFPSLLDAAQAYLAGLRLQRGAQAGRPASAALALATAVGGDAIHFTNNAWTFSCQALQAALGLGHLVVLNDFEALALSLPRLQATQLRPLGPLGIEAVDWTRNLAVVGPGTGLGVAGLVQVAQHWKAVAGEGGMPPSPPPTTSRPLCWPARAGTMRMFRPSACSAGWVCPCFTAASPR